MSAMAYQITSLTIVYSIVYSDADQIKYQSSASLAFVRGLPVTSPHKGPVTRKMFPFDDGIMEDIHDTSSLWSEDKPAAKQSTAESRTYLWLFILYSWWSHQN